MSAAVRFLAAAALGAALVGSPPASAAPLPVAATPVFPDEPFRAAQPPPGPPRDVPSPRPQVFALPNGIEVVLVERHALPTVSIELELHGGSALDPPGREGRASVCARLWSDGSETKDKIQLAQALADLAATVRASASVDATSFEVATLSRHLRPTLDLFAEVLTRPGLRADELGRIVARTKAALVAARGNPGQVAGRLDGVIAYGPAHPRGRVSTDASLDAITIDDCRAYFGGHGASGATLYVVGDLTRAQIESEVGPRLAGLAARGWDRPVPPDPAPLPGRIFAAEVAGAEQSVVVVVHAGPSRRAADFDATQVMTSILSNGFSSRINQNLREKRGWAYGAGGGFRYTRQGSMLLIQASVRADATDGTVIEILREMEGMRDQPPGDDEVAREKQGAILSLPARWATGASILATFQSLRTFGLPLDEFDRTVARVRAVDAAVVLGAARAHVHPDRAQVLVVGDPVTLRARLAALVASGPLKGAQVVRLDADGRPIGAATR